MQQTEDEPRVIEHYRRLLAGFALLLIGITWKLWTPQTLFPQIPLFEFAVNWPAHIDYLATAIIFFGAFVSLFTSNEKTARWASSALLFGFALAFLLDQHRLQPWAWQFFLATSFLLIAPKGKRLHAIQMLAISVYFFSAISKFDINFIEGSAQTLLKGFLQSLGIESETFPESMRIKLAWMFPIGELLVAVLLLIPRTRFVGYLLSLALHVSLLMTLGPRGLNHSWGVLCWNVFFIAQNILLFRKSIPSTEKSSFNFRLAFVYVIVLLPTLEWVGHWDHWPGWTVYSERTEKVRVYISKDSISRLPRKMLKYISNSELSDEWKSVNMDRWSIETLDVPQYPQLRVELANALALADRFQLEHTNSKDSDLRVMVTAVLSRWTSAKSMREQKEAPSEKIQILYGPEACDEFFSKAIWNHKPRRLWTTQNR